ncbi:MAG: Ferroporti-1 [Linnemannia elongata]|nr:MAG: Ferroporti-1 [Linnemannia elongata]
MTHGEKKALTTSIDRFCNDAEQTPRAIITSIRFLTPSSLYSVRFLSQHISTFDERLYEFASYFFIMEIFKTTLLPMSIYGFSTTVAGILFSTTVGSIVDTTPRLTAVQSFLFTQKLTTIIGSLGFWILLTWFDPTTAASSPLSPSSVTDAIAAAGDLTSSMFGLSMAQGYSLFALMVVASGVLKLSALGWSISIERDWIVALCHSNSDALTRLNVTMKRIDLVCKLISPLVFAGLLTYLHAGYCSLIMAIWCMASFLTEWVLVRRIWDLSPVLWQPRSHHHHLSLPSESVYERRGSGFVDDRDVGTESAVAAAARKKKKDSDSRTPLVDRDAFSNRERQSLFAAEDTGHHQQRRGQGGVGSSLVKRGILSFREYSHNIVFLASLAYAIIYINMMSVSGTMIGYLQYRNFSATSIATLKGICTVSELFGTILMPILTRYVGLTRAGAWSIWLEVLTLTPVLFSIYSNQLPVQVFIFAGMALSRIGVWSFDLVITQIMQEYIQPDPYNIESNNAGVINGWHYSLMNLFELAQFFLTMIWSDPQVYYIPCSISFVCVVVGAMVYTVHLFRTRGHLFHYHRIISSSPSSGPTVAVVDGVGENDGQPESSQNSGGSSVVVIGVQRDGGHDSAGVVSRRPIH